MAPGTGSLPGHPMHNAISQREREPKRRTGFNEIRERDVPGSVPRDGRNRRGRQGAPGDQVCLRHPPFRRHGYGLMSTLVPTFIEA